MHVSFMNFSILSLLAWSIFSSCLDGYSCHPDLTILSPDIHVHALNVLHLGSQCKCHAGVLFFKPCLKDAPFIVHAKTTTMTITTTGTGTAHMCVLLAWASVPCPEVWMCTSWTMASSYTAEAMLHGFSGFKVKKLSSHPIMLSLTSSSVYSERDVWTIKRVMLI